MGEYSSLYEKIRKKNLGEPAPSASKPSSGSSGGSYSSAYDKIKNDHVVQPVKPTYTVDRKRIKDVPDGYDTNVGRSGWQKYVADQERIKADAKAAEESKPWWEKLLGYMGGAQDTTMALGTMPDVIESYRSDTSYQRPNEAWLEDERYVYGYLYETDKAAAADYASRLNAAINEEKKAAQVQDVQDKATKSGWAGAAHTAGAILTAPLGLADYLDDLAQTVARGEVRDHGNISPFEYSQAVTGGVSEHLNEKGGTLNEKIPVIGGKGWGDVYGLGTSIAQSALAGYTGGSGQALVQFFGSASAAAVDDALGRGATAEQAVEVGAISGIAEGLFESIGIDNLFKIGSSATMRELVVNLAKQGAVEALEEGGTTLLNNFADQLVMQDKSNYYVLVKDYVDKGWSEDEAKKQAWLDMAEDIAYDMLGGFVSGSVHAGPQSAYQTIAQNAQNKSAYGDSAQELVAEGMESAEGSLSRKLAEKYQAKLNSGGTLTGAEISRLIRANEQQFLAEDMDAIKQSAERRLVELGEFENAAAVAEVLAKQAAKQKLTRAEKAIIQTSKYGQRVANEMNPSNIQSGEYSTGWAQQIGTSRVNAEAYNLQALADEMAGVKPTDAVPTEEGQETVAGAGKLTPETAMPVVGRSTATESGKLIRKAVDTGKSAEAADVSFSSEGEAMVYSAMLDMGASPVVAQSIVANFDGTDSRLYAADVKLAYQYGKMNFPKRYLEKLDIKPHQAEHAYNLGRSDAKAEAVAPKAKRTVKGKRGSVTFETAVDESTLTPIQRESLKGIKGIADLSGLNIHVFESQITPDGYKFSLPDGTVTGANGWYVTGSNDIWIDLNAGNAGEGTMLYTAAHEISHFIKEWSPTKWRVMADFLMEQYGEDVPLEALLERQMAKIMRRPNAPTGKALMDLAHEELVCDALSEMLVDGEVAQKLAELKQKDRTLWEKIKDAIKDLLEKWGLIRKEYEGRSVAGEAEFLRGMDEAFKKLQQLYTEAFAEASENYQQTLAEAGIAVDAKTDSGSLLSVRDVLSEADRKKVAKALAERFAVTEIEAMEWLKAETSLASLILNPKYSMYLDYEGDPGEVAIKKNSDYPQGTVDFSNICKKRREFTQVMNRVLRNFPHHVFAATDLAKIRTIMGQEGMTLPCGICYVEDRRQLDSIVAQDFINGLKLYREGSKTRPDGKPFNANQLKGLQMTDGDTYVPSIYELVTLEGRNSLKAKNPNMEAAWVRYNNARGMQSVRLLTNEAEYKRQILKYSPDTVRAKNDLGGLRIYSFSDMEMFHLIDIVQVITDSATVGLSLQGYTKVNEYARAVKDTGEKLNRSLIPAGDLGYHIEDGKVVLDYDTVEGIDIHHEDFFDNRDNPNVGNIVIGINDTQIRAAMVSDFIDQIIPFHTGQSEDVLGEKGIAAWDNYKDFQTEKDLTTGKTAAHQINIYTEVIQAAEQEGKPIQNKRQFVEKFLAVCKQHGLKPRFAQFLNTDANGDYIYTEGYHKFLVDFKTFAQTEVGEYLPQMPVKPIFDNAYMTGLLRAYVTEQQTKDAEVAKQMPRVIERITSEIIKPGEVKLSDRDYSYNTLASKPDMAVATVSSNVPNNRADVLAMAKKNAASVGRFDPKTGSVSVHVKDIGKDVIIGTPGLRHGLEGRRTENAIVTLKAGEILQNSIRINELTPKKEQADSSYVLIGAARSDSGDFYIVRSVVNTFKSELVSMDVLYAINAKKENRLRSMRPGVQRPVTDSTISVAELLDYVNEYFPDILPEDVLKHYGHDARPEGKLGEDALFSERDTAPTFYSYMARVVDAVKQEKLGAASVVSMLRGKGVKAEEIKWSGIEAWLEGKKSVTKAELQEFIRGSMLQIEEETLHDDDDPYTDEEQAQISKFEEERETIAEQLKAEWKRIVGTDIPIRNFGAGLEHSVVDKLMEANTAVKANTEAGYKYRAAKAALQRVIEDSRDDWGYDTNRQAFREAVRNPKSFMDNFEMTSFQKSVFRDFIKAKESYSKQPGIPMDDQKALISIAASADRFSSRIAKVQADHRAKEAKRRTRWGQYKLSGGSNYRELLFRVPGSDYSNDAMYTHWENRYGVLAHARIQDLNTFIGRMLFVEELQSDWHNSGHKDGYRKPGAEDKQALSWKMEQYTEEFFASEIAGVIEDKISTIGYEGAGVSMILNYLLDSNTTESTLGMLRRKGVTFTESEVSKLMEYVHSYEDLYHQWENAPSEVTAPEAPFSDNYHEFVMKRLLRMAAEGGYDSIGWTTKDIQMERWNPGRKTNAQMGVKAKDPDAVAFESGYTIEYDQDIPKFMAKYGKKWGTKVGKTTLDNGTEVWSMAITDAMQQSVLYEGQPLYSERDTDSVSHRDLLAGAFESIAQNDIERGKIAEYQQKVKQLNEQERKLAEIRKELGELSFAKGPRDNDKIRKLREEATKISNRIGIYDKQLLRLEASAPLMAVLEREKERAYARASQKWADRMERSRTGRDSAEIRRKIKTFKTKLEHSLLNPTDRQYVPIDLIQAMVDVCSLIDVDTDLYHADGKVNKAQEKRNLTKEKLQALKDEYEKLKTHSDPIYAGEFDEMVYTYLTDLRDKFTGRPLRELSLDELTEMYETLRAIDETLRDARKLIGWGDAEGVYEAGDAIVAEQQAITKSRKGGKRNAAQQARDKMLNQSLSPVRNVERMSGYHADSYLLKMFKKFEQGIRKKNKFVMEAYKGFEHLTSGKAYEAAMYTEVGGKRYEDINGRKFGISKMQMMQAILSYERETANGMHHIENGGFTFADLDMLRKGRLRDAISEEHSHRVPFATSMIAEFTKALENDKWCQDYMAAARKFFNGTAKDAINETSIALKHRIIAKDKSYIPFEVDKNFVVREISAENDIQQTINSYGMLKSTKDRAPQPLIITGLNNILDRHIEQVGNVYGLAIEVRNFNKVWNVRALDAVGSDPTVKAAVQRNWGGEGVKHIEQAVQDIQGPRHNEQSQLYRKVKSGYISATFLLNLSVVTKQIGSLYSSTSMLKWRGPVRQLGNLLYTMANHKAISAEVDKYTASAWMRRQGLSDAEVHTFMTEGKKSLIGGLASKLPTVINPGKWITGMDHTVALSLWRYAKQDTAKRTGLKGEELLKATAEFYDEVIENTQSMSDVLHRPEIQKRSDILSESFAMFKTDLFQMAGQLEVTAGRYKVNKTKETGKALGRTVYAIAMSAMWAQLMTTLFALLRYKVNHYRDDEDEELTAESWLKRQGFALAGDLIGYILPIFGSEVVGFFENIMYGESEEIVDSIALTAINDLYDTMTTVATAIKDGEMPEPAQMKKLVTKSLQVLGIPASNIIRTYEAIQLHAKDIANGEFLSFEAGVDRSAKHHIHRIVEAIDEGKTDVAIGLYEEALEETAMGKDDLSEAKSSLKTALGNKLKDGEITEEQTVDVLVTCFGYERAEAEDIAGQWSFKTEYGFSWSDRSDAYKSGAISAREMKALLVDIGGKTAEEAEMQIKVYDWQNEGYDIDVSQTSVVADYEEFCQPAGITKKTYFDAYTFYKDAGETGVAYSKTIECMPYINTLPLTADQKTALALCWWAESTVRKYKLW